MHSLYNVFCYKQLVTHLLYANCIGVGAQSTLGGGGTKFLPEKYVLKISKMSEFYKILARKLSKYPNFYDIFPKNLQNSRISHDFCLKMPEFYVIIARKIFIFRILGGGARALPAPVSYVYGKLCYCIVLWAVYLRQKRCYTVIVVII